MIEERPDPHFVDVTSQGIHRIVFAKTISLNDLSAALGKLNEQIDQHHNEPGRILVLADVCVLEKVSMDARKFGVHWLKQKRFDKLAAVCNSLYIKHFVQMLIIACGLNNEMRVYYNDIEKANEWLMS